MLYCCVSLCQSDWVIEINNDKEALKFFKESADDVCSHKRLSKKVHIYEILLCDEKRANSILSHSSIQSKQPNLKVLPRETPNDPLFQDQWDMEIIKTELAWNEVNHGFTQDEREIVIAVIDDGFDINHKDLVDNIWVNKFEIPDNNIDDDNNGYVDDVIGINTEDGTGDHVQLNHGTKVLGIIGAKGNNDEGITGVNWKIKMMLISGVNSVAEIIEGYHYILDQRRLYNETDGAEGAYVVAASLSIGIPMAFGTDFPGWCDMYDQLGAEGILSIAATDNSGYDVDELGDMPTTCDSEFLITVTNTDRRDVKSDGAAYGSTSIDLAAPGENTISTVLDDEYGSFNGTSSSAPHVSGSIGLLYATQCFKLIDISLQEPIEASRIIKKAILDGVDKIPSLDMITVTGGRLNIYAAMENLAKQCGDSIGPIEEVKITKICPNPATSQIIANYTYTSNTPVTLMLHSLTGKLVYKSEFLPSLFSASNISVDLSGMVKGMYILSIQNGNDVDSVKIIKG